MNRIKTNKALILSTACALLLAACGGGSDSGLPYTGTTTPAAISPNNGNEIATRAYTNGEGGASLGNIFASATPQTTQYQGDRLNITAVTQRLFGIANSATLTAPHSPSLNRAVTTQNENIAGNCGGSMQFSIRIDDVNGNVDGSFIFSGYCEDGDTLNGQMNITSSINLQTSTAGLMTMRFSNLTISSNSESATLNGTVATYPDSDPMVITTNMQIKDNNSGKVYWADNHVTSINSVVSGEELFISGRFYHPDYGYVDLTTPTRLYIAYGDEWPSSGVMIATGANNSKVKLTAVSNTTYHYEVDANGDGVYEVQQLELLWDDL